MCGGLLHLCPHIAPPCDSLINPAAGESKFPYPQQVQAGEAFTFSNFHPQMSDVVSSTELNSALRSHKLPNGATSTGTQLQFHAQHLPMTRVSIAQNCNLHCLGWMRLK